MPSSSSGYLIEAAKAIREPAPLDAGWLCVLVRKEPSRPDGLRAYVGEVQYSGSHGVRLTLVDWVTGSMDGNDLLVPWSQIDSIEHIVTERHFAHHSHEDEGSYGRWLREAADIQNRYSQQIP